jgi:hypothetical protein
MQQQNFVKRLSTAFIAAGLVSTLSLVVLGDTALAKGDPDHLQCYAVRDSHPSVGEAVKLLNRQFGASACKVDLRSVMLCAPTAKFSEGSPEGDDPRGEALKTDFLCYNVRCEPANHAKAVVSDQFDERKIKVGPARMLCTPTKKELIP